MKLSKHKPYRNTKYLDWLRSRNCVVSGEKAECAHHIRLGTNGGTALKPSDYFCIPLKNEYHTTGPYALHIIGEETFLKHFKIDHISLFKNLLKDFLIENFDFIYAIEGRSNEEAILDLVTIIEAKCIKKPREIKKKASKEKDPIQEKAKQLKREQDKELRQKLKEDKKDNELYEMAKEIKRSRDKALREKLKEKMSDKKSAAYQKAKELQKEKQKKLREMNKERLSKYRKELAKKLKNQRSK